MAHKDRIEAPSPVEHEFCGIHVILGLFEPFLGSFTHRSSSFWVLYVARSAVSGGESSQAIRLLAHPWGPVGQVCPQRPVSGCFVLASLPASGCFQWSFPPHRPRRSAFFSLLRFCAVGGGGGGG